MSGGSVILYSECLASKWGFQDGDCLNDILWAAGFRDNPRPQSGELTFERAVLAELVERHLVPLIPDVAVYRIPTHHNPIRLDPSYQKQLPYVSVEISAEEVARTARSILDRWPNQADSSQL